MNAQEVSTVVGSLAAFAAVLGGGIKFLLARVDEKNRQAAAEQLQARTDLQNRLNEEIRDLRTMVNRLQSENAVYMRRVFALEAFIQTHLPNHPHLPETPGWPPREA